VYDTPVSYRVRSFEHAVVLSKPEVDEPVSSSEYPRMPSQQLDGAALGVNEPGGGAGGVFAGAGHVRAKALSGLHKAATEEFIWNGVCGGDRKAEITSRNTVAGLVQRRDGVRKREPGLRRKSRPGSPRSRPDGSGSKRLSPLSPFLFGAVPAGGKRNSICHNIVEIEHCIHYWDDASQL
jgi:hypothetical protein